MAFPSIALDTFPGFTTSCSIKQGAVCAYNLFVTEAHVLLPSSKTESIFALTQLTYLSALRFNSLLSLM